MRTNKNISGSGPYSWDNITGEKYYEILDILDSSREDIDKQVAICAVIEDIDEDEILSLPVAESAAKFSNLSFLNNFTLTKYENLRSVRIGDTQCNVVRNIGDINTSQFIDWQMFIKQPLRESYDKLLSIFLIPDGHKYNEGYDIASLQKDIRTQLSWPGVQSLLNFFLNRYLLSLEGTQLYLQRQIAKTKNEKLKEDLKQQLMTTLNTMRKLCHMLKTMSSTHGCVSLRESSKRHI